MLGRALHPALGCALQPTLLMFVSNCWIAADGLRLGHNGFQLVRKDLVTIRSDSLGDDLSCLRSDYLRSKADESPKMPSKNHHQKKKAKAPETKKDTRIHIVYAADTGSFKPLFNSMMSIAQSATDAAQYVIHVIVPESDMDAAERLMACFHRKAKAFLTKSPSVVTHVMKHPQFVSNCSAISTQPHLYGHLTVFARYYIPEYISNDADRAIYLDTDTIVVSDLRELYEFPMSHVSAMVMQKGEKVEMSFGDFYGGKQSKNYLGHALDGMNIDTNFSMFNDGVMLIDIKRWTQAGITRRLEQWAARLENLDDQLVLNLVLQGEKIGFDELPSMWNRFNLACGYDAKGDARILHWSCKEKPWSNPTNDSNKELYDNHTRGNLFSQEDC